MQSSIVVSRKGRLPRLDGSLTFCSTSHRPIRSLQTEAAETSRRASAAVGRYDESRGESRRDRAKSMLRDRDRTLPPLTSPFLTDRHQRKHSYLRISLTERCNLRCMYCMPEEGVPLTPKESLLTAPEVERIAKLFVQEGVTKIRLTGGEPTIRKDLPDVIAGLSSLRQYGLKQIGITTNGLTLSRLLPRLVSNGLTHLNISLDTLDPFKFEFMTKRSASGLEKVLRGIDAALAMGVSHVKINVVAIRGLNDGKDVLDFVEWAKDRNVIVRFIEYMPFDGNRWKPEKLVPFHELLQTITEKYGPLERLQDDANDTSKHWKVPGHVGRLGFISSMTDHFCGTCNRLRITADGNLKVCLFGNSEVSLRDAMRIGLPHHASGPASDMQLLELIGAAVDRKHAKHAGMSNVEELAQGGLISYKTRPTASFVPWLPSSFPMNRGTSARFYSTGRDDFGSPWNNLDQQAEEVKSGAGKESHQSWSKYMGTDGDGDDSPWASLDAIADGANGLARPVPHEAGATQQLDWEEEAAIAAAVYASTASPTSIHLQPSPITETPPSENLLTHIDPRDNRASMVDVSSKRVSIRSAQAEVRVYIPNIVLQLLSGKEMEESVRRKGPVLQTAQLAGIMGAKKTSEIIPLCHGLNLSHVDVQLQVVAVESHIDPQDESRWMDGGTSPLQHYILVTCTAKTTSQTGVEMEALTGASIAALTLWDMLKSVGGQQMRIDGLLVTSKQGGKSGDWKREKR